MLISPVTFRANPTQQIASKTKSAIPDKTQILNKLDSFWQELNKDPINEEIYICIKKNEALLKKHYPSDFASYKKAYRLC